MIPNQWYAVLPSSAVGRGQILGLKRLGMELAFFRTKDGKIACVSDKCSHRGASVSQGVVKGDCACCPFHGLRFSPEGECKLAPSLGRATRQSLERFNIQHYAVREAYGIVYLWYGSGEPAEELPFLRDEIDPGTVYSEIQDHWNAFYSRCIENQLDVLHLPFVHYNTIGRGNKTLVNGPKVVLLPDMIQTGADNEVDVGQSPKPAEECELGSTYLKFHFPNLWVNHISDTMKILIYFVPVDEENTILYIRFYASVSAVPLANHALAWLGQFGNRVIERQDKRVVIHQKPKQSEFHSEENLFPGDGPIIQYRRIRQQMKEAAGLHEEPAKPAAASAAKQASKPKAKPKTTAKPKTNVTKEEHTKVMPKDKAESDPVAMNTKDT